MAIDHNRLGFLDRSFLHLETPTSPMHIAGLATFDAGPLKKGDGGIDIDKIRDYVASRLHLIPRYLGDTEDPRGGVRHIFPSRARYW